MSYIETREGMTGLDPGRLSFVDLMVDHSGGVWAIGVIPRRGAYGPLVWGRGYLVRFDPDAQSFDSYEIGPDISVRSIGEGPDGSIWAGTSHGLYWVEPGSGRISRPTLRTVLGEVRAPGSVDVYIDDQNILWLRDRQGLATIDLESPYPIFETYSHDPSVPTGLSPNWVDAVLPNDDGTYWIGTGMPDRGQREGGLGLLDVQTNTFTTYQYDPHDESTLSSNGIYDILRTRDGRLWVGTQQGFNLFDESNGTAIRYYLHADSVRRTPPEWTQSSISINRVFDLSESANGDLWLGTEGGLVRFDVKTGRITKGSSQPSGRVLDELDGLDLLAGSGLRARRNEEDDWTHLWLNTEDSLAQEVHWSTTSLASSRDGSVWASTFGRGLLKIDPSTGKLLRFSRSDGFPSDRLTCVIEDDGGFIWASSFDGLIRFDPSSAATITFTESDGVVNRRFAGGSCAKGASGELLFGGELGLTIVTPHAVRDNPHPPRVAVVSLTVADSLLPARQGITLRHDQNNLEIEYVGLHLARSAQLQYQYRLPPLLDEWQTGRFTTTDSVHQSGSGRLCVRGTSRERSGVERVERSGSIRDSTSVVGHKLGTGSFCHGGHRARREQLPLARQIASRTGGDIEDRSGGADS